MTEKPAGGDGAPVPPSASQAAVRATLVGGALLSLAAWVSSRLNGRWAEAKLLGDSVIDLHRAASHFPVGLLLSSALFDVAAVTCRREDLRAAGFWTHLLGVAAAAATLVLGYLGNPFAGDAVDFGAKVVVHLRAGVLMLAVFGILAVWRVLRRNQFSRIEGIAYAAATLLGVAAVSVTGYLGGHLME